MNRITLSAAAFLAAAAFTSSAASANVVVEANAAKSKGQWGAELGAGYTLLDINGFKVTPAAGVFLYDRDTTGFTDDPANEGRCLAEDTQLPVKDSRCDETGTKLYGRLEVTYSLPVLGMSVGTGARLLGTSLRPYGTVSLPLAPFIHAKGNLGPKYLSAGLQARF